MHGFFPGILKGKKGPMHKEFRGVRGSLEGGSAWEVSVETLYVYAFFGGRALKGGLCRKRKTSLRC